jgi:hypothetical protein
MVRLDIMQRMIAFFLHHKQLGHVANLVRQATSVYKDLFPFSQPWNVEAEPFANHFGALCDTGVNVALRLPGEDVFGELRRFTEREQIKCKDYLARELRVAVDHQREEAERRTARQHAKLSSIVKQIKVYTSMGKARNALNMFVYALESFSLLWPMGALPNIEMSMEVHNTLIEQLELLRSMVSTPPDEQLYQNTIGYVRECLGTNAVLEQTFLEKTMEQFEFLRATDKKKSWVFSPSCTNTPRVNTNAE